MFCCCYLRNILGYDYYYFEYKYKIIISSINIINPFTVPFLVVDLTQALCMNFTTITSAHIWADYLTVEELCDMAGVCGVWTAWQIFLQIFLEDT